MKSYLVSWLRKAHAANKLADFEREHAGTWLVWEAGPWRPPSSSRDTIVAGPQTRLLASGESLAIRLEASRPGAQLRLGRGASCELVVDDATLSRVHLVFGLGEGGRWTVHDAGSRNGSKVDGVPLGPTPVPLAPGAAIEAGAVRLTFLDAAGLYFRLRS
jgi:pSer/pThr/pTyr-binding forkhead associated (FHA) protein